MTALEQNHDNQQAQLYGGCAGGMGGGFVNDNNPYSLQPRNILLPVSTSAQRSVNVDDALDVQFLGGLTPFLNLDGGGGGGD